jgi:hypothetical protein
MDACFLWVVCVVRYRSLQRPDPSPRGVLPSVCLSMSVMCDYVEEIRLRHKENARYFSCIYLVKCEISELL